MKLNNQTKLLLFAVILIVAVAFTEHRQRSKVPGAVIVQIENQVQGKHFLDSSDIGTELVEKANFLPAQQAFGELNLKKMEDVITENHFVAACEVARDIEGNLLIHIKENKPIARITPRNKDGQYLTAAGKLLPLSERFTARVLLLTGRGIVPFGKADYWTSEDAQDLLQMLNFIYNDSFWNAQIAQLDIDKKGNITAYPQLGKHKILLGSAQNFETKLKKLRTFYDEILPRKGWSAYKTINLKYDGQIVCR